MAAPLFCVAEPEEKKFSVKPFSKGLQSARQRLATLKPAQPVEKKPGLWSYQPKAVNHGPEEPRREKMTAHTPGPRETWSDNAKRKGAWVF